MRNKNHLKKEWDDINSIQNKLNSLCENQKKIKRESKNVKLYCNNMDRIYELGEQQSNLNAKITNGKRMTFNEIAERYKEFI